MGMQLRTYIHAMHASVRVHKVRLCTSVCMCSIIGTIVLFTHNHTTTRAMLYNTHT